MTGNLDLGRRGEEIASDYLTKKGYLLVQRNFRAKRYGEVDIIIKKGNQLIFVEVKTRIGNQFGRPEEAVGFRKLRELNKMVDYYFNLNPNLKLSPQIDVIAITLNSDNSLHSLEHFENITL